jgi:hypothetical protein
MTKPSISRAVHYVSYGTPGGEYSSTCRAATIVEVGAWLDIMEDFPADGRVMYQNWDEEACVLFVMNPSGLFFNTCKHDENKAPGTWHWPERVDE